MILEGCYPYVRGGVSGWTDSYIRAMPEHSFVLWTIAASEESRGVFKYKLPSNVIDVQEVFLDCALKRQYNKSKTPRFTPAEMGYIQKLINATDPDWEKLFQCFCTTSGNPVSFLSSEQFLQVTKQLCISKFHNIAFTELFYCLRSMFLPLIYLMGQTIPVADVYHATATGFGGILGAMAKWAYQKPLILTEHGIYTREREEEILRSKWVGPNFKDIWIQLFYMLSRCAYSKADVVTSLFERAKETQIQLGCLPSKCQVVKNGIDYDKFASIPIKAPNGFIDIGAIVRIAPIKDIKTMVYSFAELKHDFPQARLHILGDTDDKEYYDECVALIANLEVQDIFLVGNTDVTAYLGKLDFTILTSISEGQPLAVIESLAAGRPCVVTDVGSCRELVEGDKEDTIGAAGICIPPMHRAALTNAMLKLCISESIRNSMGIAGKQRIMKLYTHKRMIKTYESVYRKAQMKWPE
jgi:glycosyltransferase involved in cell wall biosynthesis